MTNGVGNPDWQRRYNFSAAPIFQLTYSDSINLISNVQDSNGFPNLIVTTQAAGSLVYARVVINWYQDSAGTIAIGATDWVTPPGAQISIKVPTIARFYTVEIGPVGGTTGHNIVATIYGTTADDQNILTQNTSTPMGHGKPSVGVGATTMVILGGIFGGRVFVSVDQDTNNKWTAWLEYYDWTTQLWTQFWTIHGPDHGQSYVSDALLPYAPIRFNVQNNDTVARTMTWAIVCP